MKSLRIMVLVLAVGAVSAVSVQAQQEVDPDHFDQPAAASVPAHSAKVQKNYKATASDHQASKQHVSMASKHASGKKHHQTRASA